MKTSYRCGKRAFLVLIAASTTLAQAPDQSRHQGFTTLQGFVSHGISDLQALDACPGEFATFHWHRRAHLA